MLTSSLGHACIFLLGSSVRDSPPIPVILRSGDVLVMSGESRTFYHGKCRLRLNPLRSRCSANHGRLLAKSFLTIRRRFTRASRVQALGFYRSSEHQRPPSLSSRLSAAPIRCMIMPSTPDAKSPTCSRSSPSQRPRHCALLDCH